MIFHFTGQPGSGKTTLAKEIQKLYPDMLLIDADEIREIVGNKDYSKEGRYRNVKMIQDLAVICANQGFDVLVACIAPCRRQREAFKRKYEVVEFYLHTTQERGKESYFVDRYMKPRVNFVDVDTDKPIEECISLIQQYL